jgi:sigma-B regulation protein RsbU (phosphoserine phosphatase)
MTKREQQLSRLAAVAGRHRVSPARPRVWLLEDSPLQAEHAKQALAELDVVHFLDGASLLEQLARSAPDVLILDWELPGISGLDVLRFVRETRDEVTLPVLVLTSDEHAMLAALSAGANDFVAKPCPGVVLRARLRTLVRVHELAARIRQAEQERTDALERVYEAETRMQVALEAASIGTWELDPRTHMLQLDASSQAIMGLATPVSFSDSELVVHPDDRPRLRSALGASLDPKCRAPYAIEYRVVAPDRSERWNAVWARPYFDGDQPVRLVGAVRDATERKLASEALERDAAFRERFIAILAHDLRTPLTALQLCSQLLIRRTLTEERAKDLGKRIEATSNRMARMVADLLDFTRSRQSGGMPVELADMDLEPLCRSVVQEVEIAAPTRTIVFEHHGDTRGRWDAGRLQQITSNLVSNAIDYSPVSSEVRVTLRGTDNQVTLEVQNHGVTIPETTLRSLFDPFRRGASESMASGRSRGIGLGLYIVEQIALAHGGKVLTRSDEHTGTTFTVTLPRWPGGGSAPPAT